MIQRKQTLFILLSCIALVIMPFFSIASYFGDFSYTLNLFNFKGIIAEIQSPFSSIFNAPLIGIWALTLALNLVIIFLYKKRNLQLRLTSISIGLVMVFMLLIFIYYTPAIEKQLVGFNIKTIYTNSVGIYLPIIAFIFLVFAYNFIKKDIKTMKALDRIR